MPKISGDLGPLERAVMDFVWDNEAQVSVRDVAKGLGGRRLAYTTVMTVMDRLWSKGILARKMVGRAYLYEARGTRDDHTAQVVHRVLQNAADRRSVILGFVRAVSDDDLEELRQAIRAVERERKPRNPR